MRDDTNLFEPLLDEEVQGKPVSVRRASFRDILWKIVPRSSAALCLGLEKTISYDEPCFSHTSTVTKTIRPLVKRKRVILILSLFAFLALVTILGIPFVFLYNSFSWSRHLPKVDGIQAKQNMTAANSLGPKPLTLATLLTAKMEETLWGAMWNCLDKAAREFAVEPSIVKKNARMILQCNGTKQEFLSGEGGNLIKVVLIDGEVDYRLVHEASPDIYMARLGRHPLPLNLSSIQGVLQDVVSHNGSEELQGCLRKTLKEFPREPKSVQDNARLVVSCDGKLFLFISGEGETEINVFRDEPHRGIRYQVKAIGRAWFLRLFVRGKVG